MKQNRKCGMKADMKEGRQSGRRAKGVNKKGRKAG